MFVRLRYVHTTILDSLIFFNSSFTGSSNDLLKYVLFFANLDIRRFFGFYFIKEWQNFEVLVY